jgi:hypothetical protein
MMNSDELVNTPSVSDIIAQYEKLLTLDAQNVSSSLEDPSTLTNKVMRNFIEILEDARHHGTPELKTAIFKYFIEIYLKLATGLPEEVTLVKQKPIQLVDSQTTLFDGKVVQSGMWSGIANASIGHVTVSTSQFNLNQLIDRIFFVMNFYSKEYIPTFLEKAIETLQKYSFTQKTMHEFLAENPPKLLLSPITSRIATFINKTGAAFLIGMKNFQFTSSKFSLQQTPVSLKSMLKEYFLSKYGAKLFPEWFESLNPITREAVVNNLLTQIP